MRPRKLQIEGFTCFADPVEIDFTAMDVFVISGPTGAGKSTIIDAMCYALYGRIPRHAETSSLMSHNRDTLRVALEFESAGAQYRVLRSINRVRKTGRDGTERVSRTISPVVLEVFEGGDWQSVEGRVAKVDREIERIIGLDFGGFERCILLPQGRFQEFLSGDPTQRRALLIDLLEIGIYDSMMKAANATASLQKQRADDRTKQLESEYADATEDALAATRTSLEEQRASRERAKDEFDALDEAKQLAVQATGAIERAKARAQTLAEVQAQAEEAERLGRDGQRELEALHAEIAAAQRALDAAPYDADRHRALIAAHERARSISRIRADLDVARSSSADTGALEQARASVNSASAAVSTAEVARIAAGEHREAVQRSDLAAHLRSGLKPGDTCPVCGGAVGKLTKAAPANLKAADKALKEAESAEKRARDALATAERTRDREEHAVESAKERMKALDEQLVTADRELKAALPKGQAAEPAAIEAAVAELAQAQRNRTSRQEALDALKARDANLAPLVAESAQAVAALRASAAGYESEIASAIEEKDATIARLRDLATRRAWLDVTALIEKSQNPRKVIEERFEAGTAARDESARRVAQLEERVDSIEQKIGVAARLRDEIGEMRQTAALHQELGRLLRADHFQRFVISEAMLILAASATEHLATLYPRMALTVEDGEFFVIDHWQAEQRRSARTLSGGESFVTSLALSLALSERLPELRNAATASLESLFLDEGFGTLDEETLDVVIGALEGLRSEERLVGIITHVKELAQRIDTRIEVATSPQGSIVTVGA